jgi:hypothetical protein
LLSPVFSANSSAVIIAIFYAAAAVGIYSANSGMAKTDKSYGKLTG